MSETPAVLRHSAVYAFGAVLNRGAGFILLPLYTRYLNPSDYGILGVVAITSEVVGAVIGVKLGTAMSRLFFDYHDEKERAELVSTAIVGMGSIVAVFSVILALAADPLAGILLADRNQGDLLFLGVAGLLLNIIFSLGLQYLIILKRSDVVLVVSTIRSVLYLGLGALFIAPLGMGVFGALLAILLANALSVAGLILPLLARLGVYFSKARFVSMLQFGAPLLPGQMGELLVKFADRYLLVQFGSLAASGIFFLGLRLSSILQMALVSPFNQIYIVRRFEAHGRNEDDSEGSRVFTYFFAVLVSGALGLSLLAPQLLALIAFKRPEYHGAAAIIPLLAVAEVVRSLLLIVELGIFYAKRPGSLTAASLAGLAVHLPLTGLLIAMFGVAGAAGALVLSTTFRLAVTWWLARGLNGPQPQWGYLLVVFSAGVSAYGTAWAVELALGATSGAVARLCLAGAFPLLLLMSPIFSDQEREAARGAVAARFRRMNNRTVRVAP